MKSLAPIRQAVEEALHDSGAHGRVSIAEDDFTTYTGAPLWSVGGLDDSNWASPSAARIQGTWMVFHGSYDGTLRALPLDERDLRAPPIRSNLWFWLSFPIALVPVAAVALLLTRHNRRRRG